jgi:exonuclease III
MFRISYQFFSSLQSQGQTISQPNSVFTDLNESFQAAMSYVILSRITNIKQLYLAEFDPKKIYCSSVAKKEAERLRARAINLKKTDWDLQLSSCGVIKLSSVNCRSFQQHHVDLQKDNFIMNSDIIAIQETWLESNLKDSIPQFYEYYLHAGSKGIALLTKVRPINVEKLITEHCSIIKASFSQFDVINVYRFSKDTEIKLFTEDILPFLDQTKTQVIVGDMNINLMQNPRNIFTKSLELRGFQHIVDRPTHVLGGLIDHVYFCSPKTDHSCTLYKYHTVFWSDHTCQAVILKTSALCTEMDHE